MAGHSHSANIKYRKDRVDSQRGKTFSKLARDIMSAAREGGGDPSANLRLRYAIDKARQVSMPRDNIERAIKKGCGELQGEALEEVIYEGYATGGVAVIVQALTDNRHRTAPDLRHLFEKRGGNLATSGAVAWMFERSGVFVVLREGVPSEDEMMGIVLDVGAEDLITTEDAYEIRSQASDFHSVGKGLEEREIAVEDARIIWVPTTTAEVADKDAARSVLNLISALEDHDDVQAVASNYDIPDALLVELRAEGQ